MILRAPIIVALDKDQRVTVINQKGCEILGYSEEEIMGKNWFDQFIPTDVAEDVKKTFNALVRSNAAPVQYHENPVVARDGTRKVIAWHNSALRDEKGKITAVLSSGEDITDRKRAEEERLRLLAELQRSNSELQQFAHVASHDLQEPLRTVSNFVDLLAKKYKGKLDEKADKYISFAVEGASRMSLLINELLEFSRVDTRGKPFEPVSTDDVMNRALADLRTSIEESGAVITRSNLPEVTGDESQLKQLFQNLISNAVKFRKTGAAPRVHISAELRGGEIVFGVRDNGIGIAPEYHSRIFTMFQRLHTREEYPGTGLGLVISKRIVERHGGRIWVESRSGEGCAFYFTMPVRADFHGGHQDYESQ